MKPNLSAVRSGVSSVSRFKNVFIVYCRVPHNRTACYYMANIQSPFCNGAMWLLIAEILRGTKSGNSNSPKVSYVHMDIGHYEYLTQKSVKLKIGLTHGNSAMTANLRSYLYI